MAAEGIGLKEIDRVASRSREAPGSAPFLASGMFTGY